jgi:hypothetical protein
VVPKYGRAEKDGNIYTELSRPRRKVNAEFIKIRSVEKRIAVDWLPGLPVS